MSTLRKFSVDFELGQEILVGPNNKRETITKIEYFEKSGEISLGTTAGPRSALTFRLYSGARRSHTLTNPADKYR